MKFHASRTSEEWFKGLDYYERPCDEAICEHGLWTIDINTLDELLEFVKKHGDIVIMHSVTKVSNFEIEIYDDYRE